MQQSMRQVHHNIAEMHVIVSKTTFQTDFFSQDDNAPCHRAKQVINWKRLQNGIKTIIILVYRLASPVNVLQPHTPRETEA